MQLKHLELLEKVGIPTKQALAILQVIDERIKEERERREAPAKAQWLDERV